MASVRLAAALILAALFAASGASASPGDGLLEVTGSAHLAGEATWTSQNGALVLSDVTGITLNAESVEVRRVGERWIQSPIGLATTSQGFQETGSHGAVDIRLEKMDGGTLLGLQSDAPLTAVARGASLQPVFHALLFGDARINPERCARAMPCLETYDTHALKGTILSTSTDGTVSLYLDGAAAVLTGADGATRYEAGRTTGAGAGGVETEEAVLILTLKGAQFRFVGTTPGEIHAAEPRIQTTSLAAPLATGSLQVGGRTYLAADSRLEAAGALELAPIALDGGRLPYAPDGAPRLADAFSARVTGDVMALNLAAIPVYQEPPAKAAGLAAGLAILAAAVAYFWPLLQFHATALAAPFYTRLQPPKLLDNDVRNGIYEIIRQNPGISARSVHRKSEQSWGTVVYHLRQLEAHHLVVSRRFGRARNFYENHGKYKGMEKQLACLRSARARMLARIILETPAVSQEALSAEAGLAQPTTSYYVRKLVQATLVKETREGRYVHYLPTPELERFLEVAESPDLSVGAPDSSVKA